MSEYLKAIIYNNGDPSAGIPGDSTTIDLRVDADIFDGLPLFPERENLRSKLRSLFDELWDDKCTVLFSDELDLSGEPK